MCEIDNARPNFENLQTTEKSRGWLGFWRFSDQNKSQQRKLFDEKISNDRNERQVPEKFEKLSKKISKNCRNRYCRRQWLLRNAINVLDFLLKKPLLLWLLRNVEVAEIDHELDSAIDFLFQTFKWGCLNKSLAYFI